MRFEELRQRHKALIYEKFDSHLEGNDLVCTYKFRLEPDIIFTPTVTIHNIPKNINLSSLQNLIFHVGLAEIPSYWKVACPPKIIIKAGQLNKAQVSWWNNLLIKGLGEFFYTNKIDFTAPDLVSWEIDSQTKLPSIPPSQGTFTLVPIGGGKDSVVTLSLLQEANIPLKTMTLNPTPAALRIIEKAKTDNILVSRQIDPKLLELNQQGYLNGHTPFSSYLAFLSLLVSQLFDCQSIAISNERSSNEGNLEYKGRTINHQYSKTYEFEKSFRSYTHSQYFSFLRPLYELQISQFFSGYPEYLPLIRSCNNTTIKDGWCCQCPKCLFAFTILYPFIDESILIKTFGENLFEKNNLIPLVNQLLGKDKHKPFECVGTYTETAAAFYLSIKKYQQQGKDLPAVLQHIHPQKSDTNILTAWNNQNFLTPALAVIVKLANKSILVLGLGREGQDTLKFLQQHFPNKQIDTADKKMGAEYLQSIKDYDVIFKTPGIPLSTPQIQQAISDGKQVTSQTQLFFDLCPGTIIGVTGTKGKSTTSSLIAHILQAGDLPAKLIGNIGKPVLSELDTATKDSIFVYELSSFQLQGLTKSPHIAVVLNVASEHLDYHQNTEEYIAAKSHIAKFQTSSDTVIYNSNSVTATAIAQLSPGQKIPYTKDKNPALSTQLKGEFNLDNILPAIAVTKLFGMSDSVIKQALKTFKPLEHRLEYVGKFKGIEFYNDSLSTTPLSAIAAINALGDKVETIMLGGSERNPDLTELVATINKSQIKNVILFPDTGKKIWAVIDNKNLSHFYTTDMVSAIDYAYQHTTKGKICLLSPAAPSFSMFKDYVERGNEFKRLVKQKAHEKN